MISLARLNLSETFINDDIITKKYIQAFTRLVWLDLSGNDGVTPVGIRLLEKRHGWKTGKTHIPSHREGMVGDGGRQKETRMNDVERYVLDLAAAGSLIQSRMHAKKRVVVLVRSVASINRDDTITSEPKSANGAQRVLIRKTMVAGNQNLEWII